MKMQAPSRLTRFLVKRMLLIYSLVYVFFILAFVFFAVPTSRSNAINHSTTTTDQISNEFSGMLGIMEDYSNFIANNPVMRELIVSNQIDPQESTQDTIRLLLQSFKSTQSRLFMIIVDPPEGERITSIAYTGDVSLDLLTSDGSYQELKNKSSGSFLSPVWDVSIPNTVGGSEIDTQLISLSTVYHYNNAPYILTVIYAAENFVKNCDLLAQDSLDGYAIYGRRGNLIYSTQDAGLLLSETINAEPKTGVKGNYPADGGVIFYDMDPYSSSTTYAYVSNYLLYAELYSLLVLILILCVSFPIFFMFFVRPSISSRLSPLKELSDAMKSFEISATPVRMSIKTGDEIEDVCKIYNEMVGKIQKQMDEIIAHEKTHEIEKFKLLITQIDPHFIYNSMNIINALAAQKRHEDIVAVNSALIRILQDRLNIADSLYNTVEQEISMIKDYLSIMNYRYRNTVTVHFEIDNAILHHKIPKSIIQPMIENAYFHGLTDKVGEIKGNITVTGYRDGDQIIFEIADDGIGISSQRIEEILSGHYNNANRVHIGIRNTMQRLFHIYNDYERLKIKSHVGEGTTIILVLDSIDDALGNEWKD